jgi:FixJ family two-component response regulator
LLERDQQTDNVIATVANPSALLTPRERQVLGQIMLGLTSKQIGRVLGLSHRTIEVHRAPTVFRDVRFGSKADIGSPPGDVRFTPDRMPWIQRSLAFR